MNAWASRSSGLCAYADHLVESQHTHQRGSRKLVHVVNSHKKRLALEEIEIILHQQNDDSTLLNKTQHDAMNITFLVIDAQQNHAVD